MKIPLWQNILLWSFLTLETVVFVVLIGATW